MAFKAGRLPKMGSPICPYAGCYSPNEPCIGACRSSESEQAEYGPCSCQDSGRCKYVNGGPACMNDGPSSEKNSEGPTHTKESLARCGEADQRDKARLYDLERTKCYPFWNGNGWTYIVAPERSSKIERKGVGATVREAIDAAMSAPNGDNGDG